MIFLPHRQLVQFTCDMIRRSRVSVPVGVDIVGVHGDGGVDVAFFWDIVFVGDCPRGPLKQWGKPHLKPATKPKYVEPDHAGA
jgi:hypothetical protein